MSGAARAPGTPVALSTSSVYPERTPDAFEMAARLGYDGVEVMVWGVPVSQDADVLCRLRDYHQVPVLAVHAPSRDRRAPGARRKLSKLESSQTRPAEGGQQ